MPIKNYTTKISATKTIGEINEILVKHGARKIMMDYDAAGHVSSVFFQIITSSGEQAIKLPANTDRVLQVLKNQNVKADYEQAERVAWRIVKDWLDAQLALLETEMVQMDEIFLPYFANESGATLYELYNSGKLMIGNET